MKPTEDSTQLSDSPKNFTPAQRQQKAGELWKTVKPLLEGGGLDEHKKKLAALGSRKKFRVDQFYELSLEEREKKAEEVYFARIKDSESKVKKLDETIAACGEAIDKLNQVIQLCDVPGDEKLQKGKTKSENGKKSLGELEMKARQLRAEYLLEIQERADDLRHQYNLGFDKVKVHSKLKSNINTFGDPVSKSNEILAELINIETLSKSNLSAEELNHLRELQSVTCLHLLLVATKDEYAKLKDMVDLADVSFLRPSLESVKRRSGEEVSAIFGRLENTLGHLQQLTQFKSVLAGLTDDPVKFLEASAGPVYVQVINEFLKETDTNLDHLPLFQSIHTTWLFAQLYRQVESGSALAHEVRRLDEDMAKLHVTLRSCYPGIIRPLPQPPDGPNPPYHLPLTEEECIKLHALAQSFDLLALHCQSMIETSKEQSAVVASLQRLSESFTELKESIDREIELSRVIVSPEKVQAYFDEVNRKESSIFEKPEEIELDVSEKAQEQESPPAPKGEAERKSGDKEATPAQTERQDEQKVRREKETLKRLRNKFNQLERIFGKLEESVERMESTERNFDNAVSHKNSVYDLETLPDKIASAAKDGQARVAVIEEMLQRASKDLNENDLAQFREKLSGYQSEFDTLAADYPQCAKPWLIDTVKAHLAQEAPKKSNLAKSLFEKLVDLEGAEKLKHIACKVLPHCPPAAKGQLVMKDKDGAPLYDHVIEFRVTVKDVPEPIVCHFHIPSKESAAKESPKFYFDALADNRVEIAAWNVQPRSKSQIQREDGDILRPGVKSGAAIFDKLKAAHLAREEQKAQKKPVTTKSTGQGRGGGW